MGSNDCSPLDRDAERLHYTTKGITTSLLTYILLRDRTVPGSRTKKLLLSYPRLTFGSLDSVLVAHTRGGITLGPDEGEHDADFCSLGS